MRIAQIAPLFESVPPSLYGGTERVIYSLTEELVRRGHEVTLFATGDSQTSARLIPCCETSFRLDPTIKSTYEELNYIIHQMSLVEEMADEFDVIHNHMDAITVRSLATLTVPVVTTFHNRLDTPSLAKAWQHFTHMPVVSISDDHRKPLPELNWMGTVYNGITLSDFTYAPKPGKYLAFLGRMSEEKGPDRAIKIADALQMPLLMAAKIGKSDEPYFNDVIKPLLKKSRYAEFIGEINQEQKNEFLGQAYAYLFPIRWPEPFGLTMVEALATGVPVIATNFGSVPEIVKHGQNGFICESDEDLIQAVGRVGEINRLTCRQSAETRFSDYAMTDAYESIYQQLASNYRRSPQIVKSQAPLAAHPTLLDRPFVGEPLNEALVSSGLLDASAAATTSSLRKQQIVAS